MLVTDDDLEIDWSDIPENQVKRADVTDDFGRIAAQTAKQVITQRIREAERQIMYDEFVDRVTEVVTGIVQQGRRPQQRPRRPRQGRGSAARAPSRSTASATSRARVEAVITQGPLGHEGQGPQVILVVTRS